MIVKTAALFAEISTAARKQNVIPFLLPHRAKDRRMIEALRGLEDNELIEMAVLGQTECFSVLMDRHLTGISKTIGLMVKQRADIEDLVQNTFLKAWLNLSSFRFEANFRTWLSRVALNEVFAHYRRQRRGPCYPQPENFNKLASISDSPEEATARSESCRIIRSAIGRLPTKYREILTLCDLEQLTAPETARRLKSSVPLVKTRRFRARHMLCIALEDKSIVGRRQQKSRLTAKWGV
jgi:RNA polymerase sigma-70 factor, ECF subfamily